MSLPGADTVTARGRCFPGCDRSRTVRHVNSSRTPSVIAGRIAQTASASPRDRVGRGTSTERTMATSLIAQASTALQNKPTAAGVGRGIDER